MFCSYMLLNVSALWPHVAVLWRSSAVTFVAFYFFLYAVSAISFGVLLMSLKHYLLVAALALLVVIVTTNHLAREMLDLKVVNEQSAEWLLSETGEAADAVRAFFAPFARNLAFSVASLVPAVCVARLARRRFRAQLRPVPLFLGALLAYGLTGVTVHRYFKPYIPIESNLVLYGAAFVLSRAPMFRPWTLKPVQPPEVAKIILVVDESVTYGLRYSSCVANGPLERRGLRRSRSLGNCSARAIACCAGFRATRMLAGGSASGANRLVLCAWGGYETFLIDGQRAALTRIS
jgi:signal transduction histidine kinase